MIKTFKFKPSASPETGYTVLGTIPAGRIVRSEPITEDGKVLWLIEVDTNPEIVPPTEIYLGSTSPASRRSNRNPD